MKGCAKPMVPAMGLGFMVYLNPPKVGKNNGPNPLNIVQKAIILHTLGVQVGLRVYGFCV